LVLKHHESAGTAFALLIPYSSSHFIDLAKNKILLILEKGGYSDCPMETI
jgi:hypothetical protein